MTRLLSQSYRFVAVVRQIAPASISMIRLVYAGVKQLVKVCP